MVMKVIINNNNGKGVPEYMQTNSRKSAAGDTILCAEQWERSNIGSS
jgi:hypothetical protein